MIDPATLRYVMTYSTLIKESVDYEIRAKKALKQGDVPAFNYLMVQAQAAMDESSRRLYIQHGTDHGQRQATWMRYYAQLTPLI